jgi:hypothetical protein
MKTIKTIFILLSFFSCKDIKKTENNKTFEENIKTSLEMEKILKEQIKSGYAAEKYETDYPNYVFKEQDLNTSNDILNEYLKMNDFKQVSNETFALKIKNIFNRILNDSSVKENIIINFTNKCNRELVFYKNNTGELNDYCIYISKKHNFISELFSIPEIINYEIKFPEISTFEKNLPIETNGVKIYKWNEKLNLKNDRLFNLTKMLNRNKYLFNDDQSALNWMLVNDKDFLKQLVVIFGYDKEPKINKMVLEEFYKEYENSSPNQVERIGEFFFQKDCDNKLKIRKGLLEYVLKNTNSGDNRFLYALSDYSSNMFYEDRNNIYGDVSNSPFKKFNTNEKAQIVAYIASIEVPLIEKHARLPLWSNAGPSIYNITVSNRDIIQLIKKENYFEIENLKTIIKNIEGEVDARHENYMQEIETKK